MELVQQLLAVVSWPLIGVLVLEYVIGKTDWVKSNSLIDLVINGILKFLKKDTKL